MNNRRREKLRKAIMMIDSAKDIIDAVLDEEQDCLDNTPENLEGTERYEKMECAIDYLDSALDNAEEMKSNVLEACA